MAPGAKVGDGGGGAIEVIHQFGWGEVEEMELVGGVKVSNTLGLHGLGHLWRWASPSRFMAGDRVTDGRGIAAGG